MREKILVVEDDTEISSLLREFLEEKDYDVFISNNGLDALKKLKGESYNLVILDLMIPYKSGDEVLREMRTFSNVPVIVLSAKDTVHIKVDLLKMGADDYITKPFDLNELYARVISNLRRYAIESSVKDLKTENTILTYKDILINEDEKQVSINGVKLSFTSKEYEILKLMLLNPQKVFSKANIFESIWHEEYFSEDNTLNVHMSNIRNKLKKANPDEDYIETLWGMGYRLRP